MGVVAALLLVWGTLSTRNRWRWEVYLDRLQAEPGLVVVSTGHEGGQYLIRTGIAKKNAVLRQQRVECVVAELATGGLLAEQSAIFRSRAGEPLRGGDTTQNLAAERSVTFEVRVADHQKKPE